MDLNFTGPARFPSYSFRKNGVQKITHCFTDLDIFTRICTFQVIDLGKTAKICRHLHKFVHNLVQVVVIDVVLKSYRLRLNQEGW